MSKIILTPEQRERAKIILLKAMRAAKLMDELQKLPYSQEQRTNQINHADKEYNQVKPDWITDDQWKINPNVYHWEHSKKAMESQALLPTPTLEEVLEQTMRLRNEKNWNQEE